MEPISPTFVTQTDRQSKPASLSVGASENSERLEEVAKELEASFISEMLKSAKFGEPRKAFGGGIGEEQFTSFLRQEISRKMVESGGFGLAESLFEVLKVRSGEA